MRFVSVKPHANKQRGYTQHTMPIVVDTYNVLHLTGVLPTDLAGLDVNGFRHLIRLSRYASQDVTLVCDGFGSATTDDDDELGLHGRIRGSVRIQYAGSNTDADTIIEKIIKKSSAPTRLTIVSSDRRLIKAGQRRRCKVLSSERFLTQLADDFHGGLTTTATQHGKPLYEIPLDPGSVHWWISFFDLPPSASDSTATAFTADEFSITDVQSTTYSTLADTDSAESQHDPNDAKPAMRDEESQRKDNNISMANGLHKNADESDSTRWWLRYFGLNPDQHDIE